MVTVYSKAGCSPCRLTKAALTRQGIEFVERDVTTDEEAMTRVQELATELKATALPMVEAGGHKWSGHRPDEIDKLSA